MLQQYYDTALHYAFPALLAAIAAYYAIYWIADLLASRRMSKLDSTEIARRRVLALQKASKQTAPVDESEAPKTDPFVLKPQLPKSSNVPFGSKNMTMAELRSRISKSSTATCSIGSCCG
ncbi:hypothetical protein GGI25_000103 [Coemansia spiralis]|uniref:Uncharacterized protein n=2 Tax=Coemansia TaxID=4863 RepID=A0A9W8L1Q3_9FUNG|nr:hypothetical protein BX070DRAFT_249698 [Coemansia spiralis]KAJ1992602.1 hypothetical protein EDC05_002748 [Coemansia umbellata]KAJ2620292.1 hypothetical protein GGI26_005116 [Coemansia sp. RSA 1358]KAJ2681148.1 hypothetical protein GGI25_000103 [Coemansia spiralis]